MDRMRLAMRDYVIDQPDDFTIALYGPDDFYELHDSLASAVERKDELGLLAALQAVAPLPNVMIEAGNAAMKNERVSDVWQALIGAIADEYDESRA